MFTKNYKKSTVFLIPTPTQIGMWYGICCIAFPVSLLVPYQGHTISPHGMES